MCPNAVYYPVSHKLKKESTTQFLGVIIFLILANVTTKCRDKVLKQKKYNPTNLTVPWLDNIQ